jgi:glutamate/tyrosine decarboxylase-like PLP-dependent enzyme
MPEPRDDASLRAAFDHALDYVSTVDRRRVSPDAPALAGLAGFDEPLPEDPTSALDTIERLHALGSPATMATTGPSYFGFVIGGVHPAALAAATLASAWDQNAALPSMSPVASTLHAVVQRWLVDLLRLPEGTTVVFVTGATVASVTGLAAARDRLLARAGWDVQADGLMGAPPLPVIVGEQAHSTLSKALGLVGLGRDRVIVAPSDEQGRLRPAGLPAVDGPVLVCAQAGDVNTGAFDPFDDIADWVAERDGWLHVDGAFGLWARADPSRAHLVQGLERADSWATDAHKWLNVTYDCGIALVRRPDDLRRTFAATAGYLPDSDRFDAMHHTPQSSQRARQVEVWAVLRSLGRAGVRDLVARTCEAARTIADRLAAGGCTVLNDVVLNQVLVRLVDGPTTASLIAAVQEDGRIWCGPTDWQGETAMRISVSGWNTTLDDAERAAAVILECAASIR